jgi:protein SCO1/2
MIIALIVVMQPEAEGDQLPVIGEIPAFSLVDQDGDLFTLENVKGNVWLADFIFTTCSGPCPIMTERMGMVQHDLLDIDKLKFVSFTVNPDYDTPEVLKKYAQRFDADVGSWSFVTGKYEQIQELIVEGFKMGDVEEIVFHSTRFALVDHEGNLRGYYSGTEPAEHEILTRDIQSLINDIP